MDLATGWILFASPLVLAVILKARGCSGYSCDEKHAILRVGWPTRIVSMYFALSPLGLLLIFPLKGDIIWVLALLTLFFTVPFLLQLFIKTIYFDPKFIYSRSMFGKTKKIAWDDVVLVGDVGYRDGRGNVIAMSRGLQYYYLKSRTQGKVRWDTLLDGGEFLDKALNRYAPNAERVSTMLLEK